MLNSCVHKPFMYLRYIDDIFGIWLHGEEKLREFHALANSLHDQIKLDLRLSQSMVDFLDVRVSVKGNELHTDVYTKPTDSKAYLHFTSDHPSYMKKAIPAGLAMRAKRICSSGADFRRQQKDIHTNLSNRGYPDHLVRNGFKRVAGMDRDKLLDGATRKQRRGVPLVVTYSSHLPNITKILREKKTILTRSERLRKIFDADMFVSYKRGTNLKDILVHKKTRQVGQPDQSSQGQGRCGKNCSVCRFMYNEEERVRGPGRNTSCTYDKTIGCKSRNVIYGVFCEVCNGSET